MAAISSLANVCDPPEKPISKKVFCIAGILTTVYGLEEISGATTKVGCLWMLHPRLQTQEYMEPLALAAIDQWRDGNATTGNPALIAVSFDARNHGTRLVNVLSNQDWRGGNQTHAQDIFSIFHGTATDVSLLLDHLQSYIFGHSDPNIVTNIVLGISLGAHAAWQCAMFEPRIRAAIIALGCPDFTRLMKYRAAKSLVDTYTTAQATGQPFIGSSDFPPALVDVVRRRDPACWLEHAPTANVPDGLRGVAVGLEQKKRRRMVSEHLGGKDLFILSGRADKLVPYACSSPFLDTLRDFIHESTDDTIMPFPDLVDKVYDGVRHEVTREMVNDALDFIIRHLENLPSSSLTRNDR